MRIYYTQKGLRGTPYSSAIINADIFKVFRGQGEIYYPRDAELQAVDGFLKVYEDTGQYTDYEYVSDNGTFYIPKSVGVREVIESGKVFDDYFVVLCDDAVELRYLRWDAPWYETVGKDTQITDPDIIAKMERTLALFMEANKPEQAEPVTISKKNLLAFFTLLDLPDAKELVVDIHAAATKPVRFYERNSTRLSNDFGVERAYTGWHLDLLRLTLHQRNRLDWVDWKEMPEEVSASLRVLLPWDIAEALPDYQDADADVVQVLRECNGLLRERYGRTILLWDTGGDEYVFIIVPDARTAEAFALARKLDIPLQHVTDAC